jgi:hypothetical protein
MNDLDSRRHLRNQLASRRGIIVDHANIRERQIKLAQIADTRSIPTDHHIIGYGMAAAPYALCNAIERVPWRREPKKDQGDVVACRFACPEQSSMASAGTGRLEREAFSRPCKGVSPLYENPARSNGRAFRVEGRNTARDLVGVHELANRIRRQEGRGRRCLTGAIRTTYDDDLFHFLRPEENVDRRDKPTAVRFGEIGCASSQQPPLGLVMRVLVTRIHVFFCCPRTRGSPEQARR